MRACGNRAAGRGCGAGAAGRASERGLQLWRRPEGSGSGRRGPGRGRTRGAARPLGIGGLCFASSPMGGRAASRPICSRRRAELSVVFVLARASFPVAPGSACRSLPSTRPPLGAVPRRPRAGRTPRPGSEALASPGLPARSSSDRGVGTPARGRRREVHFEELSDEFPRRESSLQRSGQDEPPGLVETFLTRFSRLRNCLTQWPEGVGRQPSGWIP